MEPEEFRAVGDDQVAVVVRYRARGRVSGVEVKGRESALWTIRNGKGHPVRVVSRTGRRPRSRWAAGVGDVAGEREAACFEGWGRIGSRRQQAYERSTDGS